MSESDGIPAIGEPSIEPVHGKALLRRIDGDHLFSGQCAFALVEPALVSPREAPLLPAIRTQSRRRNELLLPIEYRRDFLAEREILFCDLEGGRTVATGAIHPGMWYNGIMFTRYVRAIMAKANVEKIADPLPYFASLPSFKGVWAQGRTRKEALAELQEILEEWLLLKVRKRQFVPSVRQYDLNALFSA